jgi:hypothetical protein
VKIIPAAATSRAVVLLSMKRREKKDIRVRLVAFLCHHEPEAQSVISVTTGDHSLSIVTRCLIVTMKTSRLIVIAVGISVIRMIIEI